MLFAAQHLEPEGFSEDLLDLYIYYAMTGLGHQSATLRASALSMIVLVVRQSHLLVMPLLDKLEAMKVSSGHCYRGAHFQAVTTLFKPMVAKLEAMKVSASTHAYISTSTQECMSASTHTNMCASASPCIVWKF